MKIEKITDTKIRIVLSFNDLKSNNISANNFFSDLNRSELLIENLLDIANKEIGFDIRNSKLLVETILSSNKACVFTITKVPENSIQETNDYNPFIFAFDNFENFIKLSYFLKNINKLEPNSVFSDFSLIFYNNIFYLKITSTHNTYKFFDYIQAIVSEFGKNVSNSNHLNGILNEYGKKIFDNNAFLQCITYF